MTKPKIMFFDIETAPNVVYSWRIGYKIDLTPDNIIEERKIICICWKWEGDDHTYSLDWGKSQDDKAMLKEFAKHLAEADVAIGHNGDRFDLKWLKTRTLFHGLDPINNVTTIDTLKVVRNNFNLNSNRLDYIGKYLNIGRKMETGGYQLWVQCMNGNTKALNTMIEYCRNDVVLLEEVYLKLKPYIDKLPVHLGVVEHGNRESCPSCGSLNSHKYGKRTTRTGSYQKHKCTDCAHIFVDSKQLKEKK